LISALLRRCAAALALLLTCTACATAPKPSPGPKQIGLFTTLPILWLEVNDMRGLLDTQAQPHWALGVLRQRGEVVPLNLLSTEKSFRSLSSINLLVMAQPRPLSPSENVALDRWVRRGGKVLLFADPMLTAESAYSFGDKRRPQGVVLLSPILERWGLQLEFDDDRAEGAYTVAWSGATMPVNLPGQFKLGKRGKHCELLADGLGARCKVGRGQVLAVADAALLEMQPVDDNGQRTAMLQLLMEQAAD
jgi:hypothetical protein